MGGKGDTLRPVLSEGKNTGHKKEKNEKGAKVADRRLVASARRGVAPQKGAQSAGCGEPPGGQDAVLRHGGSSGGSSGHAGGGQNREVMREEKKKKRGGERTFLHLRR